MNNTGQKEKSTVKHRILTIVGAVLCVILIPILILNITLIVKSYISNDVPSIGGWCPMIVLTDSMSPEINSGDLIICHTADVSEIKKNDVISFYDPEGNGTSVVTHRVVEIKNESGKLSFVTKGDANNTNDKLPVSADKVIGIYASRIPNAGNIAMFMQSVPGLIVCVVCPLVLLIAYDIARRRMYDKKQQKDTDALLEELERLKAEKENSSQQ